MRQAGGRRDRLGPRWKMGGALALLLALQSDDGLGQEAPKASVPAGQTVEEIVAVVGDHPILLTEVEEQFALLSQQLTVPPEDTASAHQLKREILGRLVDDQVLLLEADAQNLEVGEEEIHQAVEQEVESNKRQLGGAEGFQAQLKKEGLTEEALRARYREEARKQLLANKLIQKDVRPQITISDEDVKKFFQENRADLPKKPRAVRVQDLFLRVRPDSVLEARAKQRTLEVRQEIQAGLAFSEAAKKYSDDPNTADLGGNLGRFSRDELDKNFEQVAFTIPPGQVSEPVRSRFGWHLILVADKDPAGEWVEASHILFAVTPSRGDENRALEQANLLRRQVVEGKLDFVEAIRTHSEDEEARAQDGDLGWIPMQGFAGAVKETLDTLRVGRISQPVPGDGGFHIFKLIGEEAEGTYSFEEIQADLRQLAFQDAMQKKLRTWLDQLRTKYFVEIRAAW